MITYDEALERIENYLKCDESTEHKEALEMARMALKDVIGRARRFKTDLEDAEIDYTRDFAAEQDLYGENADDFFGKVKADGFDIMEAFHDGAMWQSERGINTKGKLSSIGGAVCFFVPSEVTRKIYHDGVDYYKDVKLQIIND